MRLGNADSQVIQPSRMCAELEKAGFADIRVRPLVADVTSLIEVARP